jgi:hypothetical protein
MAAALAAIAACAEEVVEPGLPTADVVGDYALTAYRESPLPGPYEGTRITRFRTLEGVLILRADSSYARTIVQELRQEDSSNPWNPGPVYDTVTTTESGAFRVGGDTVVFTHAPSAGPLQVWYAWADSVAVRTFESGRELLRFERH